ncbi:hypothetical protein ACQPZF_10765 [Actinosynnema sp. CS-041913]|uniref:hypothetical protein n=1 Tax=Actinosynnema sp. CS-041913 TaxID=3239917 RepID=UPI003D93B52E
MLDSPYTRYDGDVLHGRYPVLTGVWVDLAAAFPRPSGVPRRVVADGLDMTGSVPGVLSGWFRSVDGDWYGVVNHPIRYADGRRAHIQLADQLLPSTALRKRD